MIVMMIMIIELSLQVLAAGLENPSEGGEGMQYRCCIHTRDWKVIFLLLFLSLMDVELLDAIPPLL